MSPVIAPGLAVLLWTTLAAPVAPASSVTVEHAAGHPMRYHLALPEGWSADRTWPVVVLIPDASRDFAGDLATFAAVRGGRPFILVAPEVMSCGGARTRTAERYSYTPAEWTLISAGDDFAFDDAGLAAVLADVRKRWHGDAKAFLTGWEAGGHTVWAQSFRHPERWRAVAPVSPNYNRRGLDEASFSTAPERASLPIQVFRCGKPTGDAVAAIRYVDDQTVRALADARSHGFGAAAPVRVVPGADHGPLPEPVLNWFEAFLQH